jgi:hypothetical protein
MSVIEKFKRKVVNLYYDYNFNFTLIEWIFILGILTCLLSVVIR